MATLVLPDFDMASIKVAFTTQFQGETYHHLTE